MIESCDLNGGNRVQLTALNAPHPFAISVFEDYVYWTEWLPMAIHRAHRLTGLQHTVLLNSSHKLMGIQVTSSAYLLSKPTGASVPSN